MSNTFIYIAGDTDSRLWGLSGRDRLMRMLARQKQVTLVEDVSEVTADATLILLRGDYLFDPRLLVKLLQIKEDVALSASDSDTLVAIRTRGEHASVLLHELAGESEQVLARRMPLKRPEVLVDAYDSGLLKYDPPVVLPIKESKRLELENELFDGSYKGVTDFVTKWWWPVPARWAVRVCVRKGFSPNQVTLLSVVLAVVAGAAFWHGYFVTGLVMGWFMTFLDTVDGKLARVTVTSSKLGDVLDHGLDLIHPPLWYLAWGMGVAGTMDASFPVMPLFWTVLIAYVAGRLCEGAFELWLARFRLFLWQPWDAFNRLVTARRNPNLVILTLSLFAARPGFGLYLVVLWHIISTFVLMARLYLAYREKKRSGELHPWLDNIDRVRDRKRLAVRWFTRLSKPGQTET